MAKYLIYKDGDEIDVYRNGRDRHGGFASVKAATEWIKKSRKYKDGDTIKVSEV